MSWIDNNLISKSSKTLILGKYLVAVFQSSSTLGSGLAEAIMKVVTEERADKLKKDLLRMIPPLPRRLNLSSGTQFSKSVKNVLSKYNTLVQPGIIFTDAMNYILQEKKPIYGNFLMDAKNLNVYEPLGMIYFLFKQGGGQSQMDIIISPLLFLKLSGVEWEHCSDSQRVANVWYGEGHIGSECIQGLEDLIINCKFHQFLFPIGPSISNVRSSFVNKLSTVLKGEIISSESPGGYMSVYIPRDLFINLDEKKKEYDCRPLKKTIYACIGYFVFDKKPVMQLTFFMSSMGQLETQIYIKSFFTDQVINKVIELQNDMYINTLTFLVWCRVGHCSNHSSIEHQSLHLRGSSLPVVELKGFISDPGTWELLL